MKKTTAALAALLLILTGCSVPTAEYPRTTLPQPPVVQPVTVGITLPQDTDEAMEAAVVTLEAKLSELSSGKIKLTTYRSRDVAYDLQQGEVGLYLLGASQVVQMDKRLEFIQMPFLFKDIEQMMTILNSENGQVRGSPVTRKRLGGEVIGVYNGGGSWFLGKGRFFDEVGFYSTVGVLAEQPGNSCFSALGAETVMEGSSEELFKLFAAGKIKYCELRSDTEIPMEAMAKVKSLELTNHRFDSKWMILRDNDNILEPAAKSMIKQALSYTVLQHNTARSELDVAQMSRLEEQVDQLVPKDAEYRLTMQDAKRYYRQNWETLGIPSAIWEEIQLAIG